MKALLFTGVLYFTFVSVANTQGGTWTPCSKSCGGGVRTKQNCFWGICSTMFQSCNTEVCISGWSQWQPCSATCGNGTRFMVKPCAKNSVKDCPRTYETCIIRKCKEITAGCPLGHRFRYEDPTSCCKIVREKCGEDAASSRRIVGGKKAHQGQWPWMAAFVIRKTKTIYCGGTLIHKRWILAAGHCFDPFSEDAYVLLGSVTIKNPAIGHAIYEIDKTHIHVHDNYDYPMNDIALVKLTKDVTFTTEIRPICLPTGEITPVGITCVTAGWGRVSPFNKKISNDLLQVKIRTLPLDACTDAYEILQDSKYTKIRKKQHMCAGTLTKGIDSCTGDSGAPLMCQRCSTCGWYIAGTLSFGDRDCATKGTPAIYMEVYHYQIWIRKYVSLSSKQYFVCSTF